MELSEKMLRFRAKHNLTQQQCAERAGITNITWCYVERGIQKPSRLTEQKIKILIEEKEAEQCK